MKRQIVVTSGLILNRNNEMLIVKRADDDGFMPGFWELPGGKTDHGEVPEDGLKREIFEECGLATSVISPLRTASYINSKHKEKHYVEIFYICELESPNQEVKLSFEHSDFKWVPFGHIPNVNMTDFMKDILKTIFAHPLLNE